MKHARFLLISVLTLILLLSVAGCARHQQEPTALPRAVASAPAPAEKTAIQQALRIATDDDVQSTTANLKLEQLAVDSGYALTSWTRGEAGGQALLRKEEGSWKVVMHGNGNGWLGLRGLGRAGVPAETSRRLLDQIDPNWPSYESF
jgi:hypothetical protein